MDGKRSILFIGNPSDVHNLKWISFFSEQGYQTFLVCEKGDGKRVSQKTFAHIKNLGIFYIGQIPSFSILNPISIIITYLRLNQILVERKIDIVHFLFGTHALYGLLLKKPYIITTRGSDILLFIPQFLNKFFSGKIWRYLYRLSFGRATYITCTSYKQRDKIATIFGTNIDKLRVIRTGVEVESIANVDPELRPESLKGKKYIFMPRYLKPVYNNELIIQTLIQLKYELAGDYELVFIKDIGFNEDYVDNILAPLKNTRYKYHVFKELDQPEIWACFNCASLTIMTPKSDGTPNTAIEAMAAKCPLILGAYDYDIDLFSNVCIRLKANDANHLGSAILDALKHYSAEILDTAFQKIMTLGNRQIEMLKLKQLYAKIYYKEQKFYIDPLFIKRPYAVCSKCILDTNDDPDIFFDPIGICNHCLKYNNEYIKNVLSGQEAILALEKLVIEIKKKGEKKKYDCILGVSGGVDSSYMAILAKKLGLRVLCVHLDNGWNSELATFNIQNLVEKLEFDLFTYVLDWEEFKDIQLSYFKASVLDLEVPTDHAMLACLNKVAKQKGIKYVLSGHNVVTEAVLPLNFNFDKSDAVNIKNIHNQFGEIKLKVFPFFDQKEKLLTKFYYKPISVRFLNIVEYNKKEAIKILKSELGWREYKFKHGESIFTKFYQNYILIEKFHIDKRKAHLSNLICSNQITKAEALLEINEPIYLEDELKHDRAYVCKKLGITIEEFEFFMNLAPVAHEFYGVEIPFTDRFWLFRFIKSFLK